MPPIDRGALSADASLASLHPIAPSKPKQAETLIEAEPSGLSENRRKTSSQDRAGERGSPSYRASSASLEAAGAPSLEEGRAAFEGGGDGRRAEADDRDGLDLQSPKQIAQAINDPRYLRDERYRRRVARAVSASSAVRLTPLNDF